MGIESPLDPAFDHMEAPPNRRRYQGSCLHVFAPQEHEQFEAWSDRTLLQSMEAAGIPWPSSCRNGTCRTCVGRLISGRVRYDIEWPGLSREEKDEGYVLPCAAYPCSEVLLQEGY